MRRVAAGHSARSLFRTSIFSDSSMIAPTYHDGHLQLQAVRADQQIYLMSTEGEQSHKFKINRHHIALLPFSPDIRMMAFVELHGSSSGMQLDLVTDGRNVLDASEQNMRPGSAPNVRGDLKVALVTSSSLKYERP
nr:hypothetical protein CFP56_63424 [Quercus suber]